MKYQYHFGYIELSDGEKIPTIKLPEEIELVSAFLHQMNQQGPWFLDAVNQVLLGAEEFKETKGEFYKIRIREDYTEISDVFDEGEVCKIETKEFKEILEIWIKETMKKA
ncbi:MAG: hypothetical protein WCL54_03350 [Clostridia bacterium]